MKNPILLLTTILSASFALDMGFPAYADGPGSHDVVHDLNSQVTRNTFGYCVRTRWSAENNECQAAAPKVAEVQKVERHTIAEEERTAYFEFDKTGLLDSEQHKLDSLAAALKSTNDISGVSIVGYADRIGSTGYNERLSEQRAKVVEDYLRQRGYLNTTIAKTRWLGDSTPVTHCADGLGRSPLISCLQGDRRVTVEIKYQDNKSASATY